MYKKAYIEGKGINVKPCNVLVALYCIWWRFLRATLANESLEYFPQKYRTKSIVEEVSVGLSPLPQHLRALLMRLLRLQSEFITIAYNLIERIPVSLFTKLTLTRSILLW